MRKAGPVNSNAVSRGSGTVYRWVYVSRPCVPNDQFEDAVADILSRSLSRNRSLNVTGALICSGLRFSQYLEGSRESVQTLKESISRDVRHADVTDLVEGPFGRRIFPDWSLLHARSARYLDRFLVGAPLGSPWRDVGKVGAVLALFNELAAQRDKPTGGSLGLEIPDRYR